VENYLYLLLKFDKTYYAALAYILMRDNEVYCEFTFDESY
jgi:hypothetical protein